MYKDYSDTTVLLKSLTDNDFGAFTYLYNKTRAKLFLIAFLIVKDQEAAKDIVHDFFADFLEKQLYTNVTSLTTFIVQSVRNKAINYKKRQNFISNINIEVNKQGGLFMPMSDNEELKHDLDAAISKLPPMAAKVFLLHYVEKLNYNEISSELGISKSTISSHLDKALKRLRTELKKNL